MGFTNKEDNFMSVVAYVHNDGQDALAFVKNIVEAHLGYIDVDSKINEYTEFQILLPID